MHKHTRGFSLVEALWAVGLSITFLSAVTSAWYFSTKTLKEENVKSQLRYDLQKAMEKIKEDVRLSDGNKIVFYPSGASVYEAISIPKATVNGSGFFTLSSSLISWDKTVIYHIYDNSGTYELRRSIFNSFSSSSATRQSQLDSVVSAGSDINATTTVLASADSLTFGIVPTSPSFDGYASSLEQSQNTSFGSKQLAAGNHTIRFIVQGKNSASSGYRMGIDQITLSPSGASGQEAEVLTVSASSGNTASIEDMSSYGSSGVWKGNHQLEYQSTAIGNYVEFQVYYDRLLESNFSDATFNYTEISGNDPAVRVSSRENQSLLPSWQASSQTDVAETDNATSMYNKTIRNIVSASSINYGGQMVRFKFKASTSAPLVIREAYFGPRSAGTYNFSSAPSQLYFGNSTVGPSDSDGIGATGSTGSTGITIPAGHYVWSNWLALDVTAPSATDYLVSFAVSTTNTEGYETYWDAGSGTHSYMIDGVSNPSGNWTGAESGFTSSSAIHASSDMVVWTSSGTVTSQVYDTKITSPSYGTLTWTTNGSGTYVFRARTSSNSDMTGASAWSSVATYGSSPASLSVSSARYLQWQATLTAASPYSTYPEIDDVTITWPGQTAIVDISGYITKRPNYGYFSVEVDGETLVNALQVSLSAEESYQGKNETHAITQEVKAKNTGK